MVIDTPWKLQLGSLPRCRVDNARTPLINGRGPLARCVKLRVAHAPGMPGTFSPTPRVSDPDIHHGTCVTHVPWCMPGSLASGFLWSRMREKRSGLSPRVRNPQFNVSGKRLIDGYKIKFWINLFHLHVADCAIFHCLHFVIDIGVGDLFWSLLSIRVDFK